MFNFEWVGGLIFGLSFEDCGIIEEDDKITDGTAIRLYLGIFAIGLILRN